ncbi:MAG: radical SAM protein [Firmicutes bacterium]|nr:radical SAM protein [Bacillota bacterium]
MTQRVGLIQVDGKWPNLALMKLSAWHKAHGDSVEWFNALEGSRYDVIYASKVFTTTPDFPYLPAHVFKGGTGYNLDVILPLEAEQSFPDYSLYPKCDFAIGFTTRGCVRHCPFCIVPQKEGRLRVVGDLKSFWHGQRKVILLDNNLTAAPWEHFECVMRQFIETKVAVDFSQGLDARLINDEQAELLAKVRLWKRIHFAWDKMNDEAAIRRGIEVLKRHISLHDVMFYVLIGFDTVWEEDLYRVETLRGMGVDPFVMPYNRRDPYQRAFARWVNHKAVFKSVPWNRYRDSQWGRSDPA